MKSNLKNKFCLLSSLAIGSTLLFSNAYLDAHVDQVGPPPETIIREILSFDGHDKELPEAIIVGLRRDLYVGFPFLKEVRHYTEEGDWVSTHKLPIGHHDKIQGLAVSWNGHLFAIVNTIFSHNHEANGIWKISRKGKISKFADLPDNTSPRNLVFDKSNHLYVTDSVRGEIYRVGHKGGVITWLHHHLLRGDPSHSVLSELPQGANGIIMGKKSKCLFIGNTDYGQIIRVTIKKDGSAGKVRIHAEDCSLIGIGDISINRRGIIYAVNPYTDKILAIHSKGEVKEVVAGSPLEFPAGITMKKQKKGINLGFFTNFALNFKNNPGIFRMKVAVDPEHAD